MYSTKNIYLAQEGHIDTEKAEAEASAQKLLVD